MFDAVFFSLRTRRVSSSSADNLRELCVGGVDTLKSFVQNNTCLFGKKGVQNFVLDAGTFCLGAGSMKFQRNSNIASVETIKLHR